MEESTVKKRPKIICNISSTQYDIVRHVVEKILCWGVNLNEDDEDSDIYWTDSSVPPEKLVRMKHFQKINHFPGMYAISRKNYLASNLNKLKKRFPNDYNFFPKTWVIPSEIGDLKTYMQSQKAAFMIVKPEASCQGRGIFLTNSIEDIDSSNRYVVQEYLKKPLLIDGLKFDLRIYVLVTGSDPLRLFIYKEGLTRLATEQYASPSKYNCSNMFMHLTNYAVNKLNKKFIQNNDSCKDNLGHKRSLQSTLNYLSSIGANPSEIMASIEDIIIKTICSIQPNLSHHYKSCQPEDLSNSMCFEILGFDIILDSGLKPYVLEVNHTPSFTTDSPLDFAIKKNLITDTFRLLETKSGNRINFIKNQRKAILQRSTTGKMNRISREKREESINTRKAQRDHWESTHQGGYRRIFPREDSEKYEKYIKAANEIWQAWTGANINRKKKSESESKNNSFLKVKTRAGNDNGEDAEGVDVFQRLYDLRHKKTLTAGVSLPNLAFGQFKTVEKPTAALYCVNLYHNMIEHEEKVARKKVIRAVERPKPESMFQNHPVKRIKKASLRQILSLDNLNLTAYPLAKDKEKHY